MSWMNVGGTSSIRHGYSYYDEAILQIKEINLVTDMQAFIKYKMLTIIILSLISKVQVRCKL